MEQYIYIYTGIFLDNNNQKITNKLQYFKYLSKYNNIYGVCLYFCVFIVFSCVFLYIYLYILFFCIIWYNKHKNITKNNKNTTI